MKRVGVSALSLLLVICHGARGLGVTPYLPLNIEPEVEQQIERVLILGDQPVLTRPIAAANVIAALPKACAIDPALCHRVERYLSRYTADSGVAYATAGAAASRGSDPVVPNSYGMRDASHWELAGQAYLQPNDYLLINAGAVAYQGRTTWTGSMISLGGSAAQLDFGFRPHWLSPMSDSSMLMSTEAPTMPSLTLSNYAPLTGLGLKYELFLARMSNSNNIRYLQGFTAGHPELAGVHLSIEPVSGWSLAVNRLVQFGGGARKNTSFTDLFQAFFNPSKYANFNDPTNPNKVENQEASFTSTLLFPAKVPFEIYAEYAGEDTSRGRNYLLGNSALSLGVHLPRIFQHLDLSIEASEWQDVWYTHEVYLDGMTNYGLVTGNWGADQRVFRDPVGARSGMVRLGWDDLFGGMIDVRYRALQNQSYGVVPYKRYQDLSLSYAHPWHQHTIGGELHVGRDVFGSNFSRVEGFFRYGDAHPHLSHFPGDAYESDAPEQPAAERKGELFIDAGANANRVRVDLVDGAHKTTTPTSESYHFALGARRFVSEHSDLGARLELDDVRGYKLLGFRALDYRYRFNSPLALGVFLGADRYALRLPAYGIYYGIEAQWRNLLPGWDMTAAFRYADSIARDNLLPGDPVSPIHRIDSFYDVTSVTLSITRNF